MRDMGGAERNLINILTHIDPIRFKYSLYTFHLESPIKNILKEKNIVCTRIPYPNSVPGIIEYIRFIKKMRYQKINILHTYFESSDIWGTLLAKIARIPVIISSKRDLGFSKSRKVLIAYKFINPFITKIISVSDAVKHQVAIQENVNLKKILTIHNGVDVLKFGCSNHNVSLKSELKLCSSSPIVGILANISPIKGIEFFIHAAAKVLKRFPQTQFVIIGRCIPTKECQNYFGKLRSLVNELKLEKNLFFLGERYNIPEILSILDISVLPSLSEGFSNTIIESMAACKPVVVTDVGGNSEAVINQETGFIVPPQNIDKLSDAISILLADKNLARKMGQAGRVRAEKFFSIETMISKVEDLYLSTLN